MQELVNRAKELLSSGAVNRVLGWKKGDLGYNPEPAFFETAEELEEFVYNGFCGANLSKYMIEACKQEGKTLVMLKPCDSYSFNQLLKEHRVVRENAYIIGVGCRGKLDVERMKKLGIKGITAVSGAEMDGPDTLTVETLYGTKTCAYNDAMLERCHVCKGKEHMVYDEVIGESKDTKDAERFSEVEKIEAMSPEEKFAFFQKELSKCIRCNACRNVCPACSCRKCVFDSTKFDSAQKANVDSFEEKMFHIIRASMWPDVVPIAVNAVVFARRVFRFICLTANLSRISTNSMVNSRLVAMQKPKARSPISPLKTLNRALLQKGDNVCLK